MLGKLASTLIKVIVLLAKNVLALLAIMASASAIDGTVRRRMLGRGVVRARKRMTLVISNGDKDDIFTTIKSIESPGVLIDGVSVKVKHEIKRQKGAFLDILLGTLDASILGNMLTGKKEQEQDIMPYTIWVKISSFVPSFKLYRG